MQIEAGKYYRTRDGRKVGPTWTDGTRKEIVPGVYGNVIVWNDGSGDVSVINMRTATELRAVIATLTEIADALEGGEG